MRRSRWWLLLVLLAVGLGAYWWSGQTGSASSAISGGEVVEARSAAARRGVVELDPAEWEAPQSVEEAIPGGTPPLRVPATDADGQLEIAVTAAGAPRAGARVRVYLRGPNEPGGSVSQWRFAGGGATDAAGMRRVPARSGRYLVAVRLEGFAPALREVLRPAGERVTPVQVALEGGSSLHGVTVTRGSREPVPLAELTLARVAVSASGRADTPVEELIHASSDARGRFEFGGLETGRYRLEASAPGHGRRSLSVVVPRTSDLEVALFAASTLEGRVLTSAGEPAVSAEVRVFGGDELIYATTGPEGTFTADVYPGQLRVSARHGAETGALPGPVSIAAGAVVRGLTIQLTKGAAIEGTVQSKRTHAPIDGALVALSPTGGEGNLGQARSGPDGRFAVEPVSSEPYDVEVRAPGYSPLSRNGVTPPAGERFSLVLELDGTGILTGRVTDPEGRPIPSVIVQAVRMWGLSAFTFGETHQVRTGADGSYRIEGVELGRVRVSVGRTPELWLVQQFVQVREEEETHADITMREGGVVVGRVTRAGGAPLEEAAVVRAFPLGAGNAGVAIPETPVGADGRYRLELPVGRHDLRAQLATGDKVTRLISDAVSVVIEPGATLERDLQLSPAEAPVLLSGMVFEPSGAPSSGAFLFCSEAVEGRPPRFRNTVVTDELGKFVMPSRLGAPERFDLVAWSGGRVGTLRGVAKGATELKVQLAPGGAIAVTVQGAQPGEAVTGFFRVLDATLVPWIGSEPREFPAPTFTLSEVPATRVRVEVSADGGRSGFAEVNVSAGQTARAAIALKAAGSIGGRFVDRGRPVANVQVNLDSRFRQVTAVDGVFSYPELTAGTHTLTAFALGFVPFEKQLTVAEGAQVALGDVALELKRADPGTIGVTWVAKDRDLVAQWVIPDGPADVAGVRIADVLVAIDGLPVSTVQDADARLQGAPGTSVRLTLRRGQDELRLEVFRAGSAVPKRPQRLARAHQQG